MKKLLLAIGLIGLAVAILMAAPNAPIPGIISAGSPNVQVVDDGIHPTMISVTQGPDSTNIYGLTNSSSPLYFPFMLTTYQARWVVISEAWTGVTNGVVHWRGDGSNPGSVCVSPREFWFQSNWNWGYGAGGELQYLIYSNDVGVLNEGSVIINLSMMDTCYTNPTFQIGAPFGNIIGQDDYVITATVSNGTSKASIANLSTGTLLQCVPLVFAQNGNVIVTVSNGPGIQGSYSGAFAMRFYAHTKELTTGTNWPFH